MSDEVTEQDVEALAVELRERDIARQLAAGGPGSIASADTPRTTASDVIASDWHAERIAEARREGAAEALEAAATDARGMHDPPAPICVEWADWLDRRAAALRGDDA